VAIVAVGLIAVRLVPGLLRAPEPPPLGADIGLPKAKPATAAIGMADRHRPKHRHRGKRAHPSPPHDEPTADAKLPPVPKPAPKPAPEPVESAPPPAPEYVPPPAPEPAPTPVPEPAPAPSSTPGDGSEEFAPH
jgi:outer membrane biosynthesis protein TonB